MAYIINGFDGRVVTSVEDGTVDQSLDIKLVGKNYAGYGEIQNETFVHMLENFASASPPPNAIPGQIWYDSINKKIKFHYATGAGGIKLWKATGGAEVSSDPNGPLNPTAGDLWFDSARSQLKVRTESAGWLVIGPQSAGSGVTQMQSRIVKGKLNPLATSQNFSIIVSIINDEPVYIISRAEFILDDTDPDSNIVGFSTIKQGITLPFVNSSGISGVATDHIYFGTSSSSLGLVSADNQLYAVEDFVLKSNPNFTDPTNPVAFVDVGLTLGDDDDLQIYIGNPVAPGDPEPVIVENITENSMIMFKITDLVGNKQNLMNLGINRIEPGTNNVYSLGSPSKVWSNVYATTFNGTATQADTLKVGSDYRSASVTNIANSIVARDANRKIVADTFEGLATQASSLQVDSVFRTASTSASADTVAVRNGSGNLVANVFLGNLTGNVTGSVTGNATSATLASTVSLTSTNTTNAEHYITFTAAASGSQAIRTDTNLTYNPSTNTLYAGNIIGNITGSSTNAINLTGGTTGSIPYQTGVSQTAFVPIGTSGFVLTSNGSIPTWTSVSSLSGGSAAQIEVTNTSDNVEYNLAFVSGTSGSQVLRVDAATLKYNPLSNRLTTGALVATTLSSGGTSTAGTITGDWSLSTGSRLRATYADLAEKYETDKEYEIGTVVAVGGEKEVTATKFGDRAIGVISDSYAYLMNSDSTGQAVALKGRVPVKVVGSVKKGDRLIATDTGYAVMATLHQHADVFAIALETNSNTSVKLVECVIL
jgi:hypothetical protein